MIRKESGRVFFYSLFLSIITAACWFLASQGSRVAVSFLQRVEREVLQQKAYTSTEYRYEKEFQKTLSKYGRFAALYEDAGSTAVPGLISTEVLGASSDQMVPQGICIAGDYMLVTAYDNTPSFEENHSVLYVLSNQEPSDRSLLTTIVLPDDNHVGGVAFDGEQVWIAKSTDRQCSIIDYAVIQEAAASGAASYWLERYGQNVDCGAVASFLTYHDNQIWVGTYANRVSGTGMLRSYDVVKQQDEENGLKLVKQQEVQIPAYANGVDFYKAGDGTYMAVTTSKGRYFHSKVYFYQVSEDLNTSGQLFYCYDSCKFPPMAEELVCDGSNTYFLFESSATCYSTATYQKCAYPVDRICAVSTPRLFWQNHGAAYDNMTVGIQTLRKFHFDWLWREKKRLWV